MRTIDWSSGAGEPGLFGGVPATALASTDTFSVRWSGFIRPKYAQVPAPRPAPPRPAAASRASTTRGGIGRRCRARVHAPPFSQENDFLDG